MDIDKRYKTKKERLRIEKEGLPRAADGSLDYWESMSLPAFGI
jgi:bromodomain-containing protein 7/9